MWTARVAASCWLIAGAAASAVITPASAAVPTLGAHTLLGEENQVGANPAVTAPVTTQATGSSFVAFSAGYVSNSKPPTDNKNNSWTIVGQPVVYRGYSGAYNVKAYTVLDGSGRAGHTVSVQKNGEPAGELTLPLIEIRNADVLQDVAQNYPLGTTISSGSVTTTGPALLLAFWWGDDGTLTHSAVPDAADGFTIIENFVNLPPLSAVQCVVAARQVAAAGTYQVTWTETPDTGAALWLFAFQSSDTIFAGGFE